MMLERYTLKKLESADLNKYRETFEEDKAMAEHRLIALKKKQAASPDFENFNPLADEMVGIDIYIEEWEAVLDELTDQLKLIDEEADRRLGLNQTIRML